MCRMFQSQGQTQCSNHPRLNKWVIRRTHDVKVWFGTWWIYNQLWLYKTLRLKCENESSFFLWACWDSSSPMSKLNWERKFYIFCTFYRLILNSRSPTWKRMFCPFWCHLNVYVFPLHCCYNFVMLPLLSRSLHVTEILDLSGTDLVN